MLRRTLVYSDRRTTCSQPGVLLPYKMSVFDDSHDRREVESADVEQLNVRRARLIDGWPYAPLVERLGEVGHDHDNLHAK